MLRYSHIPLDSLFRLLLAKLYGENMRALELRAFKMQQVKIFRTAFSLIAAGCAVVVVSWVGLALLGF